MKEAYGDYCNLYGKTKDMETGYEQWKKANAFIEEINEKSKSSGNPDALLLEHNLTSDWTDE